MNETQKIVQIQTGFSFSYGIEKEVRIQGADPKYSDKVLITAKLSGNAETFEGAINKMQVAKREVRRTLDTEK